MQNFVSNFFEKSFSMSEHGKRILKGLEHECLSITVPEVSSASTLAAKHLTTLLANGLDEEFARSSAQKTFFI